MIVLGLNHGEINSSAAIVKNGKLTAGSPEERFLREKLTKKFPQRSIQFCLDYEGIQLSQCDFIAQAWNPMASQNKFSPYVSAMRTSSLREDYYYGITDNLFNMVQRKPQDWVFMDYPRETGLPPVYFVQHHRTHAAASFFLSPFEEAAILTADFRGELESVTMGRGRDNKLELFKKLDLPHSIGMFYAAYTELLGYKPDSDEWKVMALSAYDIECEKEYEIIKSTIRLTDDGLFELDQNYYQGVVDVLPGIYASKLRDALGGRVGKKGEVPDEWHIKIAKAMQRVSEEIAVHMLSHLHSIAKCDSLVVGGGFFMNSVFNGRIANLTPFKNIYIPYAPTDAGNSIGAAFYVAHQIKNEPRVVCDNPSSIGPVFSDEQIEEVLNRRKISYKKESNMARAVAEILSQGKVVAFFNGRMEFGDRALGCRSILGDPRNPEMKDIINGLIKYREAYRPFAPSILAEKVHDYFLVEDGFTCNYMEKVVLFKDEKKKDVPAVVHFDGSGRVQTVSKETNPDYHMVISEFERITGVPIVLNTSFNINGEPIALTPDDALNTFFNSGIEHLFLSGYHIRKL
ncbi:MAG: carbamoyltransferase [Lacibacter sp.]